MGFPRILCLEGVDGVGKTTVANHLANILNENGRRAMVIRSPDPLLPAGRFLREHVLPGNAYKNWRPDVVAKLFEAAFLETAQSLIEAPDYDEDRDVIILDRWTYSNLVYQQIFGIDVNDDNESVPDTEDPGIWASTITLFDHLLGDWANILKFPLVYFLEAEDTQVIVDRLDNDPNAVDANDRMTAQEYDDYQRGYRDVFAALTTAHEMSPDDLVIIDAQQEPYDVAQQIFLNFTNP